MMILSQAAPFDMATTSGIAQSVTLRFVDGAGAAKDISGHEFRCAVRGPGAAAIKCEPVDANTALLSWSPLKAGTHAYDLFMTSPDGAERPLIKGEIQAASRVTPPGSEDVVTIGDVKIMIPDAAEGEVKIIDPSVDAAERAESAAQEASNARNDAQNAKKEAEKSAESAATSATAAQQALEAIPQVDASGNMTLDGNITAAGGTFDGAVNANGGINIPLAAGALTDMSAVNRLYAAGLAAVTDAFSVRCYPLPANCSSSNGTVFKTDKEPNSLYFNVPANSAFTVKCGLVTNARPMHNYSSIRGWVAPVRLPAVSAKFTARFGQMTTVVRMGRDRDAFTLVPDQAAGGYRIGEIIDITFDHVRDAAAGGYHIRVREIYYSNAEQKWKMKTTQALAPETSS
ncbi:MAG: hypothetical protein AAHT63_06790, partial [Akkermansia muciniphila]